MEESFVQVMVGAVVAWEQSTNNQIIVLVNKKNTVSEDVTNYKNSWSAHVSQYSNTISVDPNKRIHHSNIVIQISLNTDFSFY